VNMAVFYQIEVFRAVMKTGTMTAAASLLHITQPSVTKHIQALESRIGGKLFVKEGRAVRPSSVAMLLQDQVEVMFGLASNIERIVDSFSTTAKRSVRVGIPPLLSTNFLAEVLGKVGRGQLEYELTVIVKDTQLLKGMIGSGLLDVAVVGDHVFQTETNIGRNPLVCAMHAAHPFAARSHVELADLAEANFVTFEKESPLRMAIEAAARAANVRLAPRAIVSTTPAQLDLVSHGFCVGVVHPFAILASKANLLVRRLEPQIMWEYKVIHNKTIRNSSLVEAFVKAITSVSEDWTERSGRLYGSEQAERNAEGKRGRKLRDTSPAAPRRSLE
jgi:DNA-binding transcriptional LysR family regulator